MSFFHLNLGLTLSAFFSFQCFEWYPLFPRFSSYIKHYLLSIKLNSYFVMSFQIIKIMFAVIILFAICWTPVKTSQIIRSYFPELFNICSMNSFYWVTTITISFHWLAMAHSFVNPIIYSFMSKSFRVSVNHLFISLKD